MKLKRIVLLLTLVSVTVFKVEAANESGDLSKASASDGAQTKPSASNQGTTNADSGADTRVVDDSTPSTGADDASIVDEYYDHDEDGTAIPDSDKGESSGVKVSYNDPRDPIEGFNRAMWNFNYNYLDRYFFRPVAHTYKDYVPSPVRLGVVNFVENLNEPSNMVNNLLQMKWSNAGGTLVRFTVNSTLGLFGFLDVAAKMGIYRTEENFSEVLGHYGLPNGPYFMAPVAGPYVTREIALDWVDDLYFPLSELTFWQLAIKWSIQGLNTRVALIDQERLLDNAIDPYLFVKETYLQYVDYKLYDGKAPDSPQEDDLLDEYMNEID